ncbi:unnamed protein product [Spirodela intermedia]|uniref:Uncharacterized protein n=1 Tax=Spirodela intermedia TaxID=51605 RepID=A0A7I8JDT0_SPIIN|nr:unnamed protein product [Spirodela intermedia]CAA6667542.1 unnamed protein product [Spirodela intermedia]
MDELEESPRSYQETSPHAPRQMIPRIMGAQEMASDSAKKHFQLAKDSEDLIEQQRASTQLGPTYHEIFLKSEDDHYALQNAKKNNHIINTPSFPINSLLRTTTWGCLKKDLDNLGEAKKILRQGLKNCDTVEALKSQVPVDVINQNIDTAKDAKKVLDELKREEMRLRKLARTTSDGRGTGVESVYLLEQYAPLDYLIEKSHSISAWSKNHSEANELYEIKESQRLKIEVIKKKKCKIKRKPNKIFRWQMKTFLMHLKLFLTKPYSNLHEQSRILDCNKKRTTEGERRMSDNLLISW